MCFIKLAIENFQYMASKTSLPKYKSIKLFINKKSILYITYIAYNKTNENCNRLDT